MEIARELYEFFGFNGITEAATFTDLINNIFQIGCGLWITIFIIRSMFMACTWADRRII